MTNEVDYFEIGTPDAHGAKEFYSALFGWQVGPPSPAAYSSLTTEGGSGSGGIWDTSGVGGGSWAIFYVNVDDVQDAIDRAQSLGASVALPFVDTPTIQFAHLVDPQGNRFAVWRPKQSS